VSEYNGRWKYARQYQQSMVPYKCFVIFQIVVVQKDRKVLSNKKPIKLI
jgi:hypothetical protein